MRWLTCRVMTNGIVDLYVFFDRISADQMRDELLGDPKSAHVYETWYGPVSFTLPAVH